MSQALPRRAGPLKPDLMSGEPFYITTAISYPNGKPHIGHAYEAIAADAIARFHRLSGRDVRFQTGTDEHGLKMVQTARDKGVEVANLAREMSDQFQAMCDKLNISYDVFQRTTDPAHHRASVAIWEAMKANGDLYLDRYEGWYSVRDEAFYEEKELIGEGDAKLSPQGTPVEWTVEESWFFKLSKYEKPLLELYENQPDFIRPESRRNEVVRFVEGGLRDLSISRTSFDWGVKVPGSPDHVMYVWVDALTNYLTGLGYPDATGDMAKFWPASLHLIGKDIVRFHAVYWPAFLMSAGLPLPKQVFGHGFVLARGGEKMSKSLGNVVDPIDLADRYGVDALRYFLLREVSFGNDGSYSEEAIVTRVNADLANNFGNLAQRCLSMIAKQLQGVLPEAGAALAQDDKLLGDIDKAIATAGSLIEDLSLNSALEALWTAMSATNVYFAGEAPWAIRKSDPARADSVLFVTSEAIRRLAIAARWAIPDGCAKILDLLGVAVDQRSFADLADRLIPGSILPTPSGVFPNILIATDVSLPPPQATSPTLAQNSKSA
jgi:methionyl-tRNA synthetase